MKSITYIRKNFGHFIELQFTTIYAKKTLKYLFIMCILIL